MNAKGVSTLKICEQKLNYLNYSNRTRDNYLSHIGRFLKSQEKSALHLNSNDFQLYLDNYKFTSSKSKFANLKTFKSIYI